MQSSRMDIKSFLAVGVICCYLLLSCAGRGTNSAGSDNQIKTEETAQNTESGTLIESVAPAFGTKFKPSDVVDISYKLTVPKVDSIALTVDSKRIGSSKSGAPFQYKISPDHRMGRVTYSVTAYLAGDSSIRRGEFTVVAAKQPVQYGHKVIKTMPHSTDAYTQGLLWHNGHLYESTGGYGTSKLRKVDLNSGRETKGVELPRSVFGEGLALMNGKLYQISWKNNKAFVYDVNSFDKIREFSYNGEGWGLTNDDKYLYMSDGSEKIFVLDSETFQRIRTIEVYTNKDKVNYINEMEMINGEIWANIYMSDLIIKINPRSGAVTGVIDMSGLLKPSDITPTTDVLNGIAYDPETRKIYVTGKNWSKLFQIEVK